MFEEIIVQSLKHKKDKFIKKKKKKQTYLII